MNNKKGSLFTILFLLTSICLSITAQQSEGYKKILTAKIDSCNNKQLKLDDTQKVTMFNLVRNSNEFTILSDFFRQKEMYGEYYQVLMMKYGTENNFDSVYFYFKAASNNYKNNGKKTEMLVNSLHSHFINWCIANSYSELAINTLKQNIEYNSAKKLDDSIWSYMTMGHIYATLGKFEQMIESGKKGLRQTNNHHNLSSYKMAISSTIAESFYILNDYRNSLSYTDSILVYLKDIPNEFNTEFGLNIHNIALADYYSIRAVNYSSLKEFEQASLMIHKLDSLFSNNEMLINLKTLDYEFQAQRNWVHMIYFYNIKDYTKAVKYLNANKVLMLPQASFPDYRNISKWETYIFEKMGKYEYAYRIMKNQFHFTDSINKINSAKEVSSLWAIFEVDKAQQEKEKSELKANRFFIISVSAGTIAIISTLLIVYFVITNRRLKEKNKVLFKQQKEQSSSIPIVIAKKERTLKIQQNEVLENTEQNLYTDIVDYLQTSKIYTDPNISRESLAKDVGTNRQYLIDAISNNTGMTFNEFINSFRIEYARNLLLSEENVLIKNVYTEAGFNNRNTFAQLFKEKYGMSPSEFRDCANEEMRK